MRVSKSFTITLTALEVNKLESFKTDNPHISLARAIKMHLMTEIERKTPFLVSEKEEVKEVFEID